ncbi:hypothetical protein M413DRAFT_12103 [Hebeloma cylindrosporum]|uniref:Uncharacterized protein n=1 Tax=Hebeloma cylindrosporum TaxID=76867 RepID=A0A0C3C7D4_HEBCY|nr:hypothetical protein M413DRAFT_12103 [Hebeloma cylindrosporum h7]
MIPKVVVCAGRSIPEHKGLLFRACRPCNGFQWVSPVEHITAARVRRQDNLFQHVPTIIGATGHSHEHDFDPDDRINSENDFPASYRPVLEDSRLAMLIHQMPENTESFTSLLRDAGPSPVKSRATFDDLDFENIDFSQVSHEGFHGFDFNDVFSTDVLQAGVFQGAEQAGLDSSEMQATPIIHHTPSIPDSDPHLNSSNPLSPARISSPSNSSKPSTTSGQRPIIATKNTSSPRKRNAKGKLECIAFGCTKFVLAPKCRSQMCKGHCVNNGGCPEHGKGNNRGQSLENSASVPTSSDHWALSRPVPTIPLQPLPSSATNSTAVSTNQTGQQLNKSRKMYRTEMSPAHEASWQQKKQAQHEALESKSLKATYERRYQNEDNEVPIVFRDQSIPTWPMYNMAASSDLLLTLNLDPQVTRMLDVYDGTLRMWETQSINRVFKVTSQTRILARRQGVTICPKLDDLRISLGNSSAIVSPMKRKASETEGSEPDTPSPKRHRRDITPSPNPPNPTFTKGGQSSKFIQMPSGCSWPDGLLVSEVVHGFVLMARAKGDQETRFCSAFRGATWSKAKFSRHQAAWRSLSSEDSEAALSVSNHMWKDLYRKRQR